MQVDLQPILQTWAWLIDRLANPNIQRVLGLLTLTLLVCISAIILIRWLMARHLDEFADRLYRDYHGTFRTRGVRKPSLVLIARCLAWVFVLKLCAELLEPFVALAFPDFGQRYLAISLYDWLVLIVVLVLLLKFWLLFLQSVKAHDDTRPDSRINRSVHRAHFLFLKPAIAMLVLMFLPDIGKRATTVAADALKAGEFSLMLSGPDNGKMK